MLNDPGMSARTKIGKKMAVSRWVLKKRELVKIQKKKRKKKSLVRSSISGARNCEPGKPTTNYSVYVTHNHRVPIAQGREKQDARGRIESEKSTSW